MRFELSVKEIKNATEFFKEHNKDCPITHVGAIGGRESYEFCCTSIGVVATIHCTCGEKKDITDYDTW